MKINLLRPSLSFPTAEGTKFHEVRGYKFAYLSKQLDDQSKSECELVCSSCACLPPCTPFYPRSVAHCDSFPNLDEACKSYSYKEKTRTCIWSMSTVGWDSDYVLYEKKGAPGEKTAPLAPSTKGSQSP